MAFLRHFNDLADPRQRGRDTCPPAGVLLLARPGALAGVDSVVGIARLGEKKLGLPRQLRPFPDGTPFMRRQNRAVVLRITARSTSGPAVSAMRAWLNCCSVSATVRCSVTR